MLGRALLPNGAAGCVLGYGGRVPGRVPGRGFYMLLPTRMVGLNCLNNTNSGSNGTERLGFTQQTWGLASKHEALTNKQWRF